VADDVGNQFELALLGVLVYEVGAGGRDLGGATGASLGAVDCWA
jgi:hypothetical protein